MFMAMSVLELTTREDDTFYADARKSRTASRNRLRQKPSIEFDTHIYDLVSESEFQRRSVDLRVLGLGLVVIYGAQNGPFIFIIPVWCHAVAFTSLSAWLLLGAPRKPRKKVIPDPPLIVRDPHGVSTLASLLLRDGSFETMDGKAKSSASIDRMKRVTIE
jgi:hypothetical protein